MSFNGRDGQGNFIRVFKTERLKENLSHFKLALNGSVYQALNGVTKNVPFHGLGEFIRKEKLFLDTVK